MSAPLRERREALRLIASEAARTRSGTGRLVLLRGATGTGRTALLEAATAQAQAHGMRIGRARCSPDDSAVPLSAVRQLLDPLPEFTDHDHDPVAVPDERVLAARLWRLLGSATEGAPLLVSVDDVHLADAASRRWLVDAARRVDRLPVLLLVTERGQYDVGPPRPGLAHTLSPSLVRTCVLRPLAADSASTMVRSAFGTAPGAEPWTDDCVRAGAGIPLLLRALLDDLQDVRPVELPYTCAALYPGAYPAAVSWWLDSAGAATAEVARALAALGDVQGGTRVAAAAAAAGPGDTDSQLLADMADLAAMTDLAGLRDTGGMAGIDPARVRGWLTAMTRLGLLRPDADGRLHYAHPLLRDAVASGWSAARRQAAHRAAAETMMRRGDQVEAVARQLLCSGPVGEPWATSVLRDAADDAVRDGRPHDALPFLRRALDEQLPDELRQRLLTELGSLEYAVARSAAAIPRLTEATRLPGVPQDRVRAAVALGTALARHGEARAGVDVLRGLDGQLTDHPDLAHAVRAACALLSDHDVVIRRGVYDRLRESAERSPDVLGPAARTLLVRYEATAGLTSADMAMKQIRELLVEPADPLTEPYLLGTAAAVAQWADELDEAERLVERGLTGQHPALLHPMHTALLNVRADIAAARGDYASLLAHPEAESEAESVAVAVADPEAHPEAEAVPAGAPPVDWRSGPANMTAHVLIALVETGRLREAARLADRFTLREAPDSWELNRFLYARGTLRAATGHAQGALDDFLECGRRQTARDVVSSVVTPWRTAAVDCYLALGRPREALALAEEELRLATVWNTPRLMGRALCALGTATGGRRGLELAEEAVRVLRTSGVATELGAALVAQARQLTTAGERTRARVCLREAAEHAERLGALRLRATAEAALRETGARRTTTPRTGPAALTDSERRIALLAADGRTNIEIAALLHLARRTVETHLTSTYRKLGIRRRAELAPALDRSPGPSIGPSPGP